MPSRFACLWLTSLSACALTLCPCRARAGEDEWQLTAGPAYAVVDFDARTPSGIGGTLELTYGLSDSIAIAATLETSAHPTDADHARMLPAGTMTVFGGFLGARYAFDLLRTIPYLDVGLGVLWAQGASASDVTNLSYEAAVGFDHLQSRRWSWGAVAAFHGFVHDFSKLPVYLSVGPTLSLRWE